MLYIFTKNQLSANSIKINWNILPRAKNLSGDLGEKTEPRPTKKIKKIRIYTVAAPLGKQESGGENVRTRSLSSESTCDEEKKRKPRGKGESGKATASAPKRPPRRVGVCVCVYLHTPRPGRPGTTKVQFRGNDEENLSRMFRFRKRAYTCAPVCMYIKSATGRWRKCQNRGVIEAGKIYAYTGASGVYAHEWFQSAVLNIRIGFRAFHIRAREREKEEFAPGGAFPQWRTGRANSNLRNWKSTRPRSSIHICMYTRVYICTHLHLSGALFPVRERASEPLFPGYIFDNRKIPLALASLSLAPLRSRSDVLYIRNIWNCYDSSVCIRVIHALVGGGDILCGRGTLLRCLRGNRFVFFFSRHWNIKSAAWAIFSDKVVIINFFRLLRACARLNGSERERESF